MRTKCSMDSSEQEAYGHELAGSVCRKVFASLLLARELHKGSEIGMSYRGTNELRVSDFGRNETHAIDHLLGIVFSQCTSAGASHV